ncbi:VanZ family protein [Actinoplanes flavus]|uniref:VanZ family protein n=1 Tax=Actinoplanes flavus TaxID=2820290 RepID=A0ABS3UY72_9ACTN|nr:VanZ family protein [Actinoplanes flavus]MBO3743512.1 VanZ family protein [Actinoplanes flavus]
MSAGDWFGSITGVVAITVMVLPLVVLGVWWLARRRRAAGAVWPWRRSLAQVGIVYGTVPWVWMILTPGGRAGEVSGRVSLVPLRDLVTILAGGWLTIVVQVVANLLVFAAVGLFGPLLFPVLRSVPRVLVVAGVASLLLEAAQYVLRLDRVSSVDDVLLNAAGAGLAAVLSRRWWPGPVSGMPARGVPDGPG